MRRRDPGHLFDGIDLREDLRFPQGDHLVTVRDAAVVLACSERTVTRMVENGTLQTVPVASGRRIRRSTLDSYIESRTRAPETRDSLRALVAREVNRARQRKAARISGRRW